MARMITRRPIQRQVSRRDSSRPSSFRDLNREQRIAKIKAEREQAKQLEELGKEVDRLQKYVSYKIDKQRIIKNDRNYIQKVNQDAERRISLINKYSKTGIDVNRYMKSTTHKISYNPNNTFQKIQAIPKRYTKEKWKGDKPEYGNYSKELLTFDSEGNLINKKVYANYRTYMDREGRTQGIALVENLNYKDNKLVSGQKYRKVRYGNSISDGISYAYELDKEYIPSASGISVKQYDLFAKRNKIQRQKNDFERLLKQTGQEKELTSKEKSTIMSDPKRLSKAISQLSKKKQRQVTGKELSFEQFNKEFGTTRAEFQRIAQSKDVKRQQQRGEKKYNLTSSEKQAYRKLIDPNLKLTNKEFRKLTNKINYYQLKDISKVVRQQREVKSFNDKLDERIREQKRQLKKQILSEDRTLLAEALMETLKKRVKIGKKISINNPYRNFYIKTKRGYRPKSINYMVNLLAAQKELKIRDIFSGKISPGIFLRKIAQESIKQSKLKEQGLIQQMKYRPKLYSVSPADIKRVEELEKKGKVKGIHELLFVVRNDEGKIIGIRNFKGRLRDDRISVFSTPNKIKSWYKKVSGLTIKEINKALILQTKAWAEWKKHPSINKTIKFIKGSVGNTKNVVVGILEFTGIMTMNKAFNVGMENISMQLLSQPQIWGTMAKKYASKFRKLNPYEQRELMKATTATLNTIKKTEKHIDSNMDLMKQGVINAAMIGGLFGMFGKIVSIPFAAMSLKTFGQTYTDFIQAPSYRKLGHLIGSAWYAKQGLSTLGSGIKRLIDPKFRASVSNVREVKKMIRDRADLDRRFLLKAKKVHNKPLIKELAQRLQKAKKLIKELTEFQKDKNIVKLRSGNPSFKNKYFDTWDRATLYVYHATPYTAKELFGKTKTPKRFSDKHIMDLIKKARLKEGKVKEIVGKNKVETSLIKLIIKHHGIIYGGRSIQAQTGVLRRILLGRAKTKDFDFYVNNARKTSVQIKNTLNKQFNTKEFKIKTGGHKGTYNLYKGKEQIADITERPKGIKHIKTSKGVKLRSKSLELFAKIKDLEKRFALRGKKVGRKDLKDILILSKGNIKLSDLFSKTPKGMLDVKRVNIKEIGRERRQFEHEQSLLYFDVEMATSFYSKGKIPTGLVAKVHVNKLPKKYQNRIKSIRQGKLSNKQIMSLRNSIGKYINEHPNQFFVAPAPKTRLQSESEGVFGLGTRLKKGFKIKTFDPYLKQTVPIFNIGTSKIPKLNIIKSFITGYSRKPMQKIWMKLFPKDMSQVRKYKKFINAGKQNKLLSIMNKISTTTKSYLNKVIRKLKKTKNIKQHNNLKKIADELILVLRNNRLNTKKFSKQKIIKTKIKPKKTLKKKYKKAVRKQIKKRKIIKRKATRERKRKRMPLRKPIKIKRRLRKKVRKLKRIKARKRTRKRIKTRTPKRTATRKRTRPRTRTPTRIVTRTRPRTRTPTRTPTRIVTRTRPRTRTPTRTRARTRTRTRVPPPPPPTRTPSKRKIKKGKKRKQGYGSYVKGSKEKKYHRINNKALSKSHSKNLARFVVDKTPKASYLTKKVKGKIKQTFKIKTKGSKFRKPRKGSKLPISAKIEKKKYRIDSPGEKAGISTKGLRKLKSQKAILRFIRRKKKKTVKRKVKKKVKRIKRKPKPKAKKKPIKRKTKTKKKTTKRRKK